MSSNRRAALAAACVLLLPCFAAAQPAPAGSPSSGIAVVQPWARAAVQGGTGGAFLTLRNTGAQADRLLSASSPAARSVELHATQRDGDVMRMVPLPEVPLPPGGEVVLRPGGMHIMLVGLVQALRPGTTLPLTLRFERAGEVAVEVAVRPAGATDAGPAHQH